MSQRYRSGMLFALLASGIYGQRIPSISRQSPFTRESSKAGNYGLLPLVFEPNRGQANKDVLFLARNAQYQVELRAHGMVMRFGSEFQLELRAVGGTPRSIRGVEPTGGRSSYFIGNDPSKWHTAIPNYRRVEYSDVYPGVNLTFYGAPNQLEYDITLAGGADPSQIQFDFQGATAVETSKGGDLLIRSRGSHGLTA
jgi:hypothetical protein